MGLSSSSGAVRFDEGLEKLLGRGATMVIVWRLGLSSTDVCWQGHVGRTADWGRRKRPKQAKQDEEENGGLLEGKEVERETRRPDSGPH